MVVGLVAAGLSVASGVMSANAQSDARKKQMEAILAQQRRDRQRTNKAIARARATAGRASGRLDRQAELASTTERLRDPLVQQGLRRAVRAQSAVETTREQSSAVGRAPSAARRGTLNRLMEGQALLASESMRVRRRQAAARARADLVAQSAQITASNIDTVARLEGGLAERESASAMQLAEVQGQPENTALIAGLAGLGSALGGLSDSDMGILDDFLGGLFGGGSDLSLPSGDDSNLSLPNG